MGKVGLPRVEPILDVVIDVTILVVEPIVLKGKPLDQITDPVGQVSRALVDRVNTLVDHVRQLDEVEVTLPGASVVLDVIGECRALDEWVVSVLVGELRVGVVKVLQHVQSILE